MIKSQRSTKKSDRISTKPTFYYGLFLKGGEALGIIEWITAITALSLSLISLLTIGTKTGRNFVTNLFQKHARELYTTSKRQSEDIDDILCRMRTMSDTIEAIQSYTIQQCRNEIKDGYYKYYNEKKIPLFERKSLDLIYELYTTQFRGNSYATLLYNEICKWEIDGQQFEDFDK